MLDSLGSRVSSECLHCLSTALTPVHEGPMVSMYNSTSWRHFLNSARVRLLESGIDSIL